MSNQSEYDEFLMFNLKEVVEEIPDISIRAYAVVTTLAAGGVSMSESVFSAYIEETQIPMNLMIETLAFLQGMGCFNVHCDCSDFFCEIRAIEESEWYTNGRLEFDMNTDLYRKICLDISELKYYIEL